MLNFLKDLGLLPGKDYSPEDVKKAWKAKCSETHPDKQGGDTGKFRQVMHAYKMLTDPSYRREESENKKGKKEDLNVRLQVPITFDDAFFGKTFRINYSRIELNEEFKAVIKEEYDIVSIEAQAPAGCGVGHPMLFPGHGLKCGDQFGDALVQLVPQPHPKFKLEGADVHATEQVALDLMLKGGEIEVQTMYGLRTLRIPPGTRPGEKLELKGGGVAKTGLHVVTVEPIYPSKDDLKKKEAWKSLDINWANHEKEEEAAMSQEDLNNELFERIRRGEIKINMPPGWELR